jgi:hypothetical protein
MMGWIYYLDELQLHYYFGWQQPTCPDPPSVFKVAKRYGVLGHSLTASPGFPSQQYAMYFG